jgi:hypothetical protein
MTAKRYSHDGVVIIDHLKKDLIDIDGREDLLELAEYVDRLQEENEQLKSFNQDLSENLSVCADKRLAQGEHLTKLSNEKEQLKQFQDTVFVLINEMIETANLYRIPIKSVDYGDDLGYWNGVYQKLKELREILEKRKK